jgi:hypothetical protein
MWSISMETAVSFIMGDSACSYKETTNLLIGIADKGFCDQNWRYEMAMPTLRKTSVRAQNMKSVAFSFYRYLDTVHWKS